ncbi:MAG: alpha/beta fold hydrolase [Thermoanaerobaculales bacterium]
MMQPSSRLVLVLAASVAVTLGGVRAAGAAAPPSASVDATVPSSLDRVAIHYRAVGEGAPTVVLIHCWMCDSSIWDNVVPELSRTHRVVTLDLPGHGKSGKDRKVWSMAAFGEDVRTVVETLHLDHVVLVGHSMGGPVMLEAARLMPGKVIGVVGVDTLLNADAKSDPKEADAWLAKMKADFRGQTQQLVHAIAGKSSDPAVIDRVAEKMSSGDPAIGLALMDSLQHYDVKAGMQAAKSPMVGINSTMRPTNVAANRKALPRFELLPLPEGVGHFPQVESPQAFNRLLEQAIALLAPPPR